MGKGDKVTKTWQKQRQRKKKERMRKKLLKKTETGRSRGKK
jgi:hypothetical protein